MTVVDTLVHQHRDFLRFLERRLGDRALAEDILQDAFVRSIERHGDVRDEESATAWFYRTLRNALVDRARRNVTRAKALESLAAELDEIEPPKEARDVACGCVSRLATTLKPEYREAITEVELEGKTVADFAREAGITANNAAVRLHRARAALRESVRASCGTCAEHGCVDCTCAH